MAAAYATIIFLILLLWTVFGARIVRSEGATRERPRRPHPLARVAVYAGLDRAVSRSCSTR